VKKEAKLSASEANDEEVGKGDADLRQSNLFTVCQRRRGWPATCALCLTVRSDRTPRRAARCDAARHRPNDNKLISMSTEKYARSRRVWIR